MRRGRVRYSSRRKKSKFPLILSIILLLAIGGGAFYAYTSPMFERDKPKIIALRTLSANSKTPIKFKLEDNVGLKSCKVVLSSNGKEYPIYNQKFLISSKSKVVKVALPKEITDSKNSKWDILISATDSSLWNFMMGNSSIFRGKLIIDNTPPKVDIVASSQNIRKGGSGLVIYRVEDEHLKSSYVDIGNGIKFRPVKYKKDGVYATLIAWPFNMDEFNPKVVAIDNANNKSVNSLQIYKLDKVYKTSKIKASDKFIDGKISELAQNDSDYSNISDRLKKLKAVNELMRKKNEDLIHKLSKGVTPFQDRWSIKPFKPLKGSKRVSDFGVKRYYYYKTPDNIVSTSYHVGYDFASIKHDNIYSSNKGVVVFASRNGIYGNMPLIDHGFGLYTLYGHCSSVLVKKGDRVKENQVIAKTGVTGLALGDHLHFGVLVQGIEVLPLEWMKARWIDDHINLIFRKADENLGIIR
jgi:murein DD-endopeptidase MepM/ murein hydrolase activator NlpD